MTEMAADLKADEAVRKNVGEELRWDTRLQTSEIGVVVADGVATLTGNVDSLLKKFAAEDAAQHVHGVRAVANEIEVRLPSLSERSDSDIAHAVATALEWDTFVPKNRIHTTVTNGRVTLSGEVEWQHQRYSAEEAVRHLMGVKAIDNQITIKPQPVPAGLKATIEAALVRGAKHDAHKIRVEVLGRTIILRGTVRSWAERNQAQMAAWSAPGVNTVQNLISVSI